MSLAYAEEAYRVPRVLVVDDDDGLREQICRYLGDNGFETAAAANAAAMDRALAARGFDAVVLDVMMPGEDGLSVCRRLSQAKGPAILFMSALGAELDRILGLELGADDYLAKPCSPRELLARLRAVLRRRADGAQQSRRTTAYGFEGYRLDLARRELTSPAGAMVALTAGEFSLLLTFLEHPRTPLSRERLSELSGVGGDAIERAVDVQVFRLRRKLGFSRDVIRTLRGAGYLFHAEVSRL